METELIDFVESICEKYARTTDRVPQYKRGDKIPLEFVPHLKKEMRKVVVYNKSGGEHMSGQLMPCNDANNTMFRKWSNGVDVTISVADYYRHYKNSPLQYPSMNLIMVGKSHKAAFIPMECLLVKVPQEEEKAQQNYKDKDTLVKKPILVLKKKAE